MSPPPDGIAGDGAAAAAAAAVPDAAAPDAVDRVLAADVEPSSGCTETPVRTSRLFYKFFEKGRGQGHVTP